MNMKLINKKMLFMNLFEWKSILYIRKILAIMMTVENSKFVQVFNVLSAKIRNLNLSFQIENKVYDVPELDQTNTLNWIKQTLSNSITIGISIASLSTVAT